MQLDPGLGSTGQSAGDGFEDHPPCTKQGHLVHPIERSIHHACKIAFDHELLSRQKAHKVTDGAVFAQRDQGSEVAVDKRRERAASTSQGSSDSGTRSIAIELRCHAQRPKRSVYAAWRHNNHHDHINYPDTPCTTGRASLLDRRHGGSCGSAVALQPSLGDGQQERLGGCHTALQAVFLYRDHLAENGIVRRPIMSPYGTALGVPASALWETRGGRRLPVASSSRLAHSIPPGQRRV